MRSFNEEIYQRRPQYETHQVPQPQQQPHPQQPYQHQHQQPQLPQAQGQHSLPHLQQVCVRN